MTLKDSILAYLARYGPTTDRKLADAHGTTNQHVNQIARGMEAAGLIRRARGSHGLILNVLLSQPGATPRHGATSTDTPHRGPTQQVIAVLRQGPATDAEIAARLGMRPQQVYQITERLCAAGRADKDNVCGVAARTILREAAGSSADAEAVAAVVYDVPGKTPHIRPQTVVAPPPITEDELKNAVAAWLSDRGWKVDIAWGRSHGIDIEAFRDGRRLILEAKGDCASQPQQTNYFLGAVGELVQRSADPAATYGLALPDHRTFRGLVSRLPTLARERLVHVVIFVRKRGIGFDIELDGKLDDQPRP